MNDIISAIFRLLQASKFEEIKNNYLLEMISFDDISDENNGDTLLHYFFNNFDELLPVSTLNFLISCFFRIDHFNKENKTAVHILLEKHPSAIDYFNCLKGKGIPLFEKRGNCLSIFELIISSDNLNIFQPLIENFNLTYIREFYYEKSLALALKYDSILIFDLLISESPFDLYTLFQEFLGKLHIPTSDEDKESANYQFFLAIKNSKKKIFNKIFENHPDDRIVTLDMLYYCDHTSFCIYLSKYIKEGEYSKISIQNDQKIRQDIFDLVNDLSSKIYESRSIIHLAAKKGQLDIIKQIPSIMYDSHDYSGNTPLYYAIEAEQYKVAKYLIKHGDCDFCHLGKKTTPLHLAVKGRLEILEIMLSYVNSKKYKRLFDINVKDSFQNIPLLAPFFSEQGKMIKNKDINPSCLKLIIENGADITACDSQGNNILFYVFKFFYIIKSPDFFNYILNQRELTLTEKGKESLLIQLFNQRNIDNINIFLDRFEIDADFMRTIFCQYEIPSIEKVYSLLKKQGKNEIEYFFECLKNAKENVINLLLKNIDGLIFYVDSNDNNNNILFILANFYFHSDRYLKSILITIFEAIIEHDRDDFLLIKNKENGDTFLHVAIRKSNGLLIQIMLDIYQKKENKIFKKFPDNKERIWSSINKLFYQSNDDKNNRQNPIELGTVLFFDFGNIFPFEIFEMEPSYIELENFLNKIPNPNVFQNGEPLLIKYVNYEKFDEDEMLRILELFDSYHCDFTLKKGDEYAALILLNRRFSRALDYLLSHQGVGLYAPNIVDIINDYEYNKEKLNENDFIDDKLIEKIKKFSKYYDAFVNLRKYIRKFDVIKNAIYKTLRTNSLFSDDDKSFWPLLPSIQRMSTFNDHYALIIDSFQKFLTFESPIQNFFEKFIPFYDNVYGQFYTQILAVQNQFTMEQIEHFMIDSNSIIGNFSSISNFWAAFESNIADLIKYNLNNEMKEKLLKSREKCQEVIDKVQVYSPQIEEFKEVIKDKEIVYDIDYDISQLSSKLYQVFVEIIDCRIDLTKFLSQNETKEFYLICTDEVILLAFVDSDKVHFFFKEKITDVFCETIFNYDESKMKLFTIGGMIEFKQIDISGDKCHLLKNIGQLMINRELARLNKIFEDTWKLRSELEEDDPNTMVCIQHIQKENLNIVQLLYHCDKNLNIDEVKRIGIEQIQQNLYKNNTNMLLFSLKK